MVFAAGADRRAAVLCEQCAEEVKSRSPKRETALDEFGRDLTADAAAGRIDPVIGRTDEIEQTVEILARRRKNNAVLIGEAGVGKTAIAEGLALRIHRNEVPETLAETRIVALDLSGMIAGAQFRGQFEKRFKEALDGGRRVRGQDRPVPRRAPHGARRGRARGRDGRRQHPQAAARPW